MSWENVEKNIAEETVIDSKIIGFNKGGLIVGIGSLRGFVPSSQFSQTRRAQSTGDTRNNAGRKMIGQPISVRIIEVDRERRRLILSERAANTESRSSMKDRVISELEEGETHTGRVTSLADFGAFVNINGADGLVHLSELSWDRIQHPKEMLEVGQEVQVKVINVDKDKKRIGLSMRALQDDPWKNHVGKFSVGQLVEGTITRLTKFGAFARLEGDIEGLIHISELSENRVEHPKEVLHEGDKLALRIIKIEADKRRIGLSLRKVGLPLATATRTLMPPSPTSTPRAQAMAPLPWPRLKKPMPRTRRKKLLSLKTKRLKPKNSPQQRGVRNVRLFLFNELPR